RHRGRLSVELERVVVRPGELLADPRVAEALTRRARDRGAVVAVEPVEQLADPLRDRVRILWPREDAVARVDELGDPADGSRDHWEPGGEGLDHGARVVVVPACER